MQRSEQSDAETQPVDEQDLTSGLPLEVEPGEVDVGDDAFRGAANDGTTLKPSSDSATEGILNPGNADLGADVYRG